MISRRIKCCLTTLTLATLIAPLAFAGFGGTDVYLPSVGRGPGAASSNWYTTVWVNNPSAAAVNVQFLMYERNGSGTPIATFSDSIQPGDTARYPNAVENMFGLANAYGAIRVIADDKVVVNSRIYSVPAGSDEADSVGQFFSGVPAEFAIGAGESTDLLGVYQTNPQAASEYRYNFGFMETTGAQATVRASAVNDLGVTVASNDYVVGPFQPQQMNISNLVPAINQQNLRIRFEVIAGAGKVVVFGSGLANSSNDPSTFEMTYSDSLLGSGGSPSGIGTVNAGQGLSGGGSSSAVTLDVGAGEGISVAADTVSIANGGVTKAKLAAAGGSSGQVLGTDGSGLQWLDVGGGSSTITGITAGQGLTGGGTEGAVVLDVGAGSGISVAGDTVSIASGGVTTSMLADANVTKAKLAAAGGSAGQFLSTDGSNLSWADAAAGGITLPYYGTVATGGKAFHVENSESNGLGWAGFFKNTNSNNTYPALVGSSLGSGTGVYGINNGTGVGVTASSVDNYGLEARSNNSNAIWAHGNTSSGITPNIPDEQQAAIWADGGDSSAIFATTAAQFTGAMKIESTVDQARGIFIDLTGSGTEGLYVNTNTSVSGNYAAYLRGDVWINQGDLDVTGTLSKGGGSFKIDHPLDPENKYLLHSFVESPDMMNVYNGNVVLDADGRAVIELPEWFEALNREFRYQLTPIGAPGPNLYVASEVSGNQFEIAGGSPGMKVSWQLTGIRHDAWAEANRIPVELDKDPEDVGRYLYPKAFGVDPEMGIIHRDEHQ